METVPKQKGGYFFSVQVLKSGNRAKPSENPDYILSGENSGFASGAKGWMG
ncbi:MAG: hypothetical protein HOA90_13170 [Prolixibacteraceae bacterium]|nr:hypothetical protein [Prolixibacteraceae bacterium]